MPVFTLESSTASTPAKFDEHSSIDDVRVLTHRDQESLAIGHLQSEVDSWYAEMRAFEGMDPSDIFMRLAAFSARASEIRTQVQRTDNRRLTAFRTKELDPFLQACEFQFKVWSRVHAVRDMEFRLSGGAV